jgi:hypothetical protein
LIPIVAAKGPFRFCLASSGKPTLFVRGLIATVSASLLPGAKRLIAAA